MGLWDTLKKHAGAQFLEVIDWMDDSKDTLVYRYPTFNQAITDNSKLVVREGQAVVFVAEGRLSEVFAPGTYPLDTKNAPIMRFFQSIVYKLEEPYKGDIYFVNTRQFMENGWGTATPIMLRDAEFGPVRVRAYGVFSYRITDPATFLRQIVGTDGLFTTDEINGQLKKKLVGNLAAVIGKARIAILDLAASYAELGDQLRDQLNPSFAESYGITLTDFTIQSISLPEEVEKALDTRTKMGLLGNLDAYTKMKAADAIEIAAKNPGMGGLGASMGVGFGLGNQIGAQMGAGQGAGVFNPNQGLMGGGAPPAPPPPPPVDVWHYSGAAGQMQLSTADLAARMQADPNGQHMVWKAGFPAWKNAKEVPELMALMPAAPPPLPGAQPYHYNGPAGQGTKTLDEVVAAVSSNPSGAHHVWQAGWPGWKKVQEVPEIASRLGPPGPPPLP
ncbi:MAG: SPFH domain-containing protein [Alphaproteobacteria bacterium]|nr:SPFH domain-containing protein [Alphaproteobacteria bacterium]